MKRFVVTLLVLVVVFVSKRWSKELPATADGRGGQEPPECTSKNGDVDGDGTIALGDVIKLLICMFAPDRCPEGLVPVCPDPRVAELGNELEACREERDACQIALEDCQTERDACQTDLAACLTKPGLPATGMTACYDGACSEIACSSPDYPGQDGDYRSGCPVEGRYNDNGDGTVTDECTGLMWQQETAPGEHTWQEALQYCDNLELAGYDDWRLPNVIELASIVDFEYPDVSADPFAAGEQDFGSWSSTPFSQDGTTYSAWVVSRRPLPQLGEYSVGVFAFAVPCSHIPMTAPARAVRGGL